MEQKQETAGLIYGSFPHYIDHLAPLCSILEIPLVVTCEKVLEQVITFYPDVEPLFFNPIKAPNEVASLFKLLFVCTPKALFNEIFFLSSLLLGKQLKTVWCPHGNSDKGHIVPYMEGLKEESLSLVYGEKMIDFLKQKGVFSCNLNYLHIGNYRKAYYEKYSSFYDTLAKKHLFSTLQKGNTNLLYAPTWEDAESSSSFSQALPYLVESLPKDYNLIVKPHPNLLTQEKNIQLIEKFSHKNGVLFLQEFPPIYPLLAQTDIYIGDMSSIGYDFLSFTRPMFFITGKKDISFDTYPLLTCGKVVNEKDLPSLYLSITNQKENLFQDRQKQLYSYTFAKKKSLLEIKQEITSWLLQEIK